MCSYICYVFLLVNVITPFKASGYVPSLYETGLQFVNIVPELPTNQVNMAVFFLKSVMSSTKLCIHFRSLDVLTLLKSHNT